MGAHVASKPFEQSRINRDRLTAGRLRTLITGCSGPTPKNQQNQDHGCAADTSSIGRLHAGIRLGGGNASSRRGVRRIRLQHSNFRNPLRAEQDALPTSCPGILRRPSFRRRAIAIFCGWAMDPGLRRDNEKPRSSNKPVFDFPELRDLDRHDVAVPEESRRRKSDTDASRGAGGDDIAGHQRQAR